MQNCCSYNYYCTTIVFTPLSAEEEKKKYYLIEMSWVRETDRKKQDWSYSISYQHYRQDHLYHYHHIMLKIKEQKMMIISSFIIKSNGSRLRKKKSERSSSSSPPSHHGHQQAIGTVTSNTCLYFNLLFTLRLLIFQTFSTAWPVVLCYDYS